MWHLFEGSQDAGPRGFILLQLGKSQAIVRLAVRCFLANRVLVVQRGFGEFSLVKQRVPPFPDSDLRYGHS